MHCCRVLGNGKRMLAGCNRVSFVDVARTFLICPLRVKPFLGLCCLLSVLPGVVRRALASMLFGKHCDCGDGRVDRFEISE